MLPLQEGTSLLLAKVRVHNTQDWLKDQEHDSLRPHPYTEGGGKKKMLVPRRVRWLWEQNASTVQCTIRSTQYTGQQPNCPTADQRMSVSQGGSDNNDGCKRKRKRCLWQCSTADDDTPADRTRINGPIPSQRLPFTVLRSHKRKEDQFACMRTVRIFPLGRLRNGRIHRP